MITVGDKTIKLQIWDTVTYLPFRQDNNPSNLSPEGTIAQLLEPSSSMILPTGSHYIINRQSYNNVSRWLEEARINGNSEMCFVVVGNKCDMESE